MYEKVCKMLADQLGIAADTITPESEVVKDLGADSLDVVELMMTIEDEYGVTLPEGEVENVKTVQDIVEMMERLNSRHLFCGGSGRRIICRRGMSSAPAEFPRTMSMR